VPRGRVVREGVPTAADKGSAKEELPLRQELKHGGHNLRGHLHPHYLAASRRGE
jgi:hypothetical protein